MLTFAFCIATLALVLQSILLAPFTLLAYAPWIALAVLSRAPAKSVWLAALSGAIVDLLSDDPMGLHALNYALSALSLSRFRKHFLADDPLHLSLFTALVSFSSTLLQLFLLFLFDRRVPFAGKWIFCDLIGMPVADGIYALVCFAGPLIAFKHLRRRWSLVWRQLKQSLFPT